MVDSEQGDVGERGQQDDGRSEAPQRDPWEELGELVDDFIWIVDECTDLIDAVQALPQQPDYAGEDLENATAAAVVVLAVAGWEAYVEDVSRVILHAVAATTSSVAAKALILSHEETINRFRTPNTQNSRQLLGLVGLDVDRHWGWEESGRRVSSPDVARRLDEWVRVRHRAAHGRRDRTGMPGFVGSSECVSFFHRLMIATDKGARATIGLRP